MKEVNIAIIAALVSFLSAIYSGMQASSAKKSLKLQEKIYADEKPNLSFQIINSFLFDSKEEKYIDYYFYLGVYNKSNRSNSIREFTLKIISNDKNINVIQDNKCQFKYEKIKITNLPINIGANESFIGWIAFRIEKNIYDKLDINGYILSARDIFDIEYNEYEVLVREEVVGYE